MMSALATRIRRSVSRLAGALFGAGAVAYVVNVDWPTGKALVHRADCEYYVGRVPKKPADGGWEGPFRARHEALACARDTGVPEARQAGCCNP